MWKAPSPWQHGNEIRCFVLSAMEQIQDNFQYDVVDAAVKEPTNSQRPVQASPKGQGIGSVTLFWDVLGCYESWVVPAGVPSALADIGGRVEAN